MYSWIRLKHLADWTKGRLENPPENPEGVPVTAISTDSRAIKKGEVFLALRGENFDGHDFVKTAVENGAGAVIAERPMPVKVPVLVVDDGLRALVAIAEEIRRQFKGTVGAVTGSAGKSSTKDMVATLLGPDTVSSPASFNNLMGVSRTLYLVTDSTRYLMLEMGMNNFKEIEELCRHFRPQLGAITNIGDAHIGKLGGKRGIFQAKKEMFDWLGSPIARAIGVALNVEDPLVAEAYASAIPKGMRTITYSANGANAAVMIKKKSIDPHTGFLSLTLVVGDDTFDAHFPIFGMHHAQNISAAIALATLFGVTLDEMKARFDEIRPAYHRGEVTKLAHERILIDESYNSNPTALTSSLTSLCDLDPSRRRVLVLGEMRELGEFSEKLHHEVGEALVALHAKSPVPLLVVGVAGHASHLVDAVKTKIPSAETLVLANVDEAKAKLPSLLKTRDVIFVKGSRGVALDKLVTHLLSLKA